MNNMTIAAIITMPWTVMLLQCRNLATLACLALQLSIIGWPLAVIWAWRTQQDSNHMLNAMLDALE